jgi:hypothetical protein
MIEVNRASVYTIALFTMAMNTEKMWFRNVDNIAHMHTAKGHLFVLDTFSCRYTYFDYTWLHGTDYPWSGSGHLKTFIGIDFK